MASGAGDSGWRTATADLGGRAAQCVRVPDDGLAKAGAPNASGAVSAGPDRGPGVMPGRWRALAPVTWGRAGTAVTISAGELHTCALAGRRHG